ncbi:MAG: M13 family peptidase [Candidatus Saccharibacteria bacterium]|nr:M13 family peptidase [Moraxellaceae bacterium]
MTRTLIAAAVLTQMTGNVNAETVTPSTKTLPPLTTPNNATPPSLISGISLENMDDNVRAQDDFYTYVNGKWLKNTDIPADKSSWGSFNELAEKSLNQLHSIIDTETQKKDLPAGSIKQKIVDFYASYMDEVTLEKLGMTPLNPEFTRIDAIQNKKQLATLIAHLSTIDVGVPLELGIGQDAKDSTKVVAGVDQGGLGLPDRDYYLKDDEKLKTTREKYLAYIEKMLILSADATAKQHAADILALETEIAKIQWTKVENRDPVKTYNPMTLNKLKMLAPHFDWTRYLVDAELQGKTPYLVIGQPSYVKGFDRLLEKTPLDVWKVYFKWHVLNGFASQLSKPYVDERFSFYGTTLRGVPENELRWKRAVKTVEGEIGEGLGQLYVEQYFPAENKARMEKLVSNLITAYRQSINTLDWMSAGTKKEAQKKLDKLVVKIGYPNKWRNYDQLEIKKDQLVANIMRSSQFEYQRQINKLGKPVNREEWGMTPQTVNAYYNPSMNEIVFPAAILQPPFFHADADDAVNYGGIGAVIGHEISHGFDDQGSQFDEVGNLRNWWTAEDHKKFATKTKALISQYNAYSPVKGYHVNGELTLGENIADNSGLAIAYKAYQLSLGGKTAPVLDGLTGDQRLYFGWAQVWRSKTREAQQIVYLKSDPHSPAQFRGDGALANQPHFYDAFGVKSGDKMYLTPDQRVIMW